MTKKVAVGLWSAAVVVVGALIVLLNTLWIGLGHGVARAVLSTPIALLAPIVLIAVGISVVWLDYRRRREAQHREGDGWARRYTVTVSDVAGDHALLLIGVFVGAVIAAIAGGAIHDYVNQHSLYSASAVSTEKDADAQSYEERVPFDVAASVSSRSLGDTSGNAVGNVK